MRILPFALCALLSIQAFPSNSKDSDNWPSFFMLGSENERSVLAGRCDGKPPYKQLECNFSQLFLSETEADKELKDLKGAIKNNEVSLADIKKGCTQINQAETRNEVDAEQVKERKPFLESRVKFQRDMCDCKTLECVVEAFKKEAADNKNGCTIEVTRFKGTYKRLSNSQWATEPTEDIFCGGVTVSSIQMDKPHLWLFTQTTIAPPKKKTLCKDLDLEKPLRYSWRHGKKFVMNCTNIEIGLLSP